VRPAASDADTEPLSATVTTRKRRRRASIDDDTTSAARTESPRRSRRTMTTTPASPTPRVEEEEEEDYPPALDEDELEDLQLLARSESSDRELDVRGISRMLAEEEDNDIVVGDSVGVGGGVVNSYEAVNLVKTKLVEEFERRGEKLIEFERETMALRQRVKNSESLLAATTAEVETLRVSRDAREDGAEARDRSLAEERQAHMVALEREVCRACEAEARTKALVLELSALKESYGKLEANFDLERAETTTEDAAERGESAERIVELEDALADTQAENARLEGEVIELNTQLTLACGERDAAEQRATEADEAVRQVERLVADAEAAVVAAVKEADQAKAALRGSGGEATLPTSATELAELRVINKTLHEELKIASSEAAEVKTLRRRAELAATAEERLHAAEARAIRAEANIVETSVMQERLAKLEYLEKDWQAVMARVSNAKSPSELARRLVTLEKQLTAQAGDQGAMMSDLAQTKTNLDTANRRVSELEDKYKAAESAATHATHALAKAERQVELLTNEIDGLNRIVKSYEDEGAAAAKVNSKHEQATSTADKKRVIELEGELDKAKARVAVLEKASATAAAATAAAAAAAAAVVPSDTSALDARIEALEAERYELELRLSRGEFNPQTTKVLHFKANPVAMAGMSALAKEAEELRSEATGLREAMQKLKDGTVTSGAEADIAVLQSKVAELQKREQRLMTVFRRQIRVFREACHKIFGYNIEMTEGEDGNATFKLTSDYAAKSNDTFIFKFDDKASEVSLVPSPFVQVSDIKRSVETFVERCKSIPAFIGNHTVEMFNKHNDE